MDHSVRQPFEGKWQVRVNVNWSSGVLESILSDQSLCQLVLVALGALRKFPHQSTVAQLVVEGHEQNLVPGFLCSQF